MATFTYKKISYLNDPYQQYLSSKAASKESSTKTDNSNKNNFLSPESIKKDHRTTKLLLDVKEFGAFSNIDKNANGKTENNLTVPNPNFKNTLNVDMIKTNNELLAPPSFESTTKTNNSLLAPAKNAEKNVSLSETNKNKHSSFINPLMDMKFDVGGLFDDGDKSSEDLFGAILSKYDKMEEVDNGSSSEKSNEETPKLMESLEEIKKENRISQGTIKMKRNSTIKGECTLTSNDTIKGNCTINASSTIKSNKHGKHGSQDTIKIIQEKTKKIDSFDNQLVENLNAQPAIIVDKDYLNDGESEEENNGFNPDIYKEDEKIELSYSNDWEDPWRSGKNKKGASSMKSSQSKLSAFSSFTFRSSKKLGKMTKNLYKKLTKQKPTPQLPMSPIDIPSTYNEKERAFEEMIFRDDTISLSLSNPNGSLTSTFADKTFPLTENVNENQTENNEESEKSFVSSTSSYDGEGLESKKKRHRQGINFEEALKEGNEFRVSLANL
ncbi:hypothetical protein BCR36DRAFT_582688 [Piromyces finnis]|uniref:Uncharacterized protein n=1 Tax=Piromyces finnis TaxID=1754191 RepID=A0A1Y1VCI4_9FUNG|nr:hypothetical protein BCR36DRAFT_582688 [Piromyces finnis]|eukprot:ORX52182.1 hypothetical protein BCR36DRAFT_582688 [Piromyces finnis]